MEELGDSLMTEAVCSLIMKELDQMMASCQTCVKQVAEFMKVANCILSRREFYDFLALYKRFDSDFVILENLAEQIDEPLNLLQAVTLKATMKELKKEVEEIVVILQLANERIDDNHVDVNMAKLIQRLMRLKPFESLYYEDLEKAMEKTFLILEVVDCIAKEYDNRYFPFNYLKISAFTDKVAAFQYAIGKGISRDDILNRHGSQLT
ncbi:MAG: hypothetical protein FWF59_05470 [Turicibacter sp.]|nr:hypothetical protein [Turicibacter sp.]